MTGFCLKRLTEEEMAVLRRHDPTAGVKEFQVSDEDGLVIDYFESDQEARRFLDQMTKLTIVEDAFRDWAQKTAEEVGITREEVRAIVKESF